MPVSALIADDEYLVRRSVTRFLKAHDVTIVGECEDGKECVEAIKRLHPDLLFLDLQMPELDGRQVIERVGAAMPLTIILTAYDDFAVQAYDANVVDYILKPFGKDRFERAMKRALTKLEPLRSITQALKASLDERLTGIAQAHQPALVLPARMAIPLGEGRHTFINVNEIEWIEAQGNFVRIHCRTHHHDIRMSMSAFLTRLDQNIFLRIHRSTVVNLQQIKEVQTWFKGHHVVLLDSGKKLRVSRHQESTLEQILRSTPFGG